MQRTAAVRHRGYTRPAVPEGFDVAVLGGGSGGDVAAIRAARLGLRTALVERDTMSGQALHI